MRKIIKNESLRITVALFTLGTVLLSIACGTGTQNVNQNKAAVTGEEPKDPCGGSTAADRVNSLQTRLHNEFSKKEKLKDQYKRTFDFSLGTFSTKDLIEIKIKGRVSGKGGETSLEYILDILDDFLEEGCIQRVWIDSTPIGPGVDRMEGFEWSLCEHPYVYCANGSCKDPALCNRFSNSNMNVIPNSSPNANSSGNSSSNKGNANN